MGYFMNQEAYGNIVSESFYDNFPTFIKDKMFIDGAYRQPTFYGRVDLIYLGLF